jgi:hypothetical protein
MHRRSVPRWRRVAAGALLAAVFQVQAQGQGASPHERLAFFEGQWTTSDAKPEDVFHETCAWLGAARRHMVCRASWVAPTGRVEGLSVFSYEASSGDFLYHGFRSGGAVVVQRGRPTADGWAFASEQGEGATRVRQRVSIAARADRGFDFVAESASGDGPWTERSRVSYRRLER